MSIEPTCEFCNNITKNRCNHLQAALACGYYDPMDKSAKVAKLDKPYSFGFSFEDEADIENRAKKKVDDSLVVTYKELREHKEALVIVQERLGMIYNRVDQFLQNLQQNPEKDVIRWPNRVKEVSAFREALKNIMEGKDNS